MLVRKKYIDIGQIKGCLKHGQIASNLGKHSQSVHGCICLHQVVHIILKRIGYIFHLLQAVIKLCTQLCISRNRCIQNLIFSNLSKRLATMIREDMDFMGPVRMKDVEEAQQKIVNIIRKLEDSSEIIISRGGGDEIVV